MERSLLSQFLKLLRKHRALSEAETAEKMNMTLSEYIELEDFPDEKPLSKIQKLLKVLKASDSEYKDFCNLVEFMLANTPKETDSLSVRYKN